jgi:pimeloyl-ACP methyl ester carboxylesterase
MTILAFKEASINDLIVVVPGIGGSVLQREGKRLWDTSWSHLAKTLFSGGEAFQQLTLRDPMGDDGVTAPSLIDGLHVIPGFWSYGAYSPLTKRLRARFGASNVVEFPYDWRRSNADTARRLKRHIDEALKDRPGTSVVIVAHSMGGLVARRYLACEAGAERCRLLVTIGTPYRGAVKALDVLANGLERVPGATGRLLGAFLRSVPAVYELLPTYDCVVQTDGTRVSLATHPPASIVQSQLFEAAQQFHRRTAQGLADLGAQVDTIAVVGQRQPTKSLVREKDGELQVLPDSTWQGAKTGDTVIGAGDGTVHRGAAQPPEWGQAVRGALPSAGRHVNLPQTNRVLADIVAFIEGGQFLGLGAEPQEGFGIELPDVLCVGQPLEVEARHTSDRLDLILTIADMDTGQAITRRSFRNDGGGTYRAIVRDLLPGAYEVVAEGVADGAVRHVSDVTVVMPAR